MSFIPKPTLDNRHFLGISPQNPDASLLGTTGNEKLDAAIFQLSNDTPGADYPSLMAANLITAGRVGLSDLDPHDMEMINKSAKEMLESELLFEPYKNFRKVAVFGSARIQPGEPSYEVAKQFSELLQQNGFMVITGAGGGIMQAGNEGAGPEYSFGLSIDLPFESGVNPFLKEARERVYDYHYFFVRKLYFVKMASAFAAFPGGFGTMDEIFESLTLIQTGKTIIYPVVLIDAPGKSFWKKWETFIQEELTDSGLISKTDHSLYYITQDPEDAVRHIKQFYKVFHSYRFIQDKISIRILHEIPASYIKQLNEEFCDLIETGSIKQGKAMNEELDEPFLRALPRLTFKHKINDYARLRQLIDRINEAPAK